MRRRVAPLLAAAFAVLLLAPVATARSAGDSAVGAGVRSASCPDGCPEITFEFAAQSSPTGGDATGTFYANIPDTAEFWADVTCLRVSGATAVLAGVITSGTGEEVAAGNPFVVVVSDSGRSNKGVPKDDMSLLGWGTFEETAAELCADPTAFLGIDMLRLVSGEITVSDQIAPAHLPLGRAARSCPTAVRDVRVRCTERPIGRGRDGDVLRQHSGHGGVLGRCDMPRGVRKRCDVVWGHHLGERRGG
jgi:hypothetical protein